MSLPFISAICCTYKRPQMLTNSIACFEAQQYDGPRELIILDDAGQIPNQVGDSWEIISSPRRFRTLSEKHNAAASLARGELMVVWDDDDIYAPHHLATHALSLSRGEYSKPVMVGSLYTGQLQLENSAGRFHGSIGFTRKLFERANGWPVTHRGDFDQAFMARLVKHAGPAIDTGYPTYIFRWGTTNHYHVQAYITDEDSDFYNATELLGLSADPVGMLFPKFDDETLKLYLEHYCDWPSGAVKPLDRLL